MNETFQNNTEKINDAEKYLMKFLGELKTHFDFTDMQLVSLLKKVSKNLSGITKPHFRESFKKLLFRFYKLKQ